MNSGRQVATLFLALATAFAAQLLVVYSLSPHRSILAAASVAAAVTLALGAAIAVAHLPVSSLLNRVSLPARPFAASAVYGALFPVAQLFIWLLFRDSTETVKTLAVWYVRFPGEVLATALPLALGGVVFGFFGFRTRARTAVV